MNDILAIHGGKPVSDRLIPSVCVKLAEDEITAATDVMRAGALRDGNYCRDFEDKFAAATQARYGLVCTNGTVALQLAYGTLVQQGDEVLCPGYTFIATASMVLARGAKPLLCEVKPDTFNIDVADAEKRITDKTTAIAPVHLYGNSADIAAIQKLADKYNLKIIYDAAQSHLASYKGKGLGAYGDAVTYSFYPTKNMTTGEGGMVTVNDPELAKQLALIRDHGMEPGKRYHHVALGYNYRSNDVAAAIGIKQLEKLPQRTEIRKKNAHLLTELLLNKAGAVIPPIATENSEHVYHQYTIRLQLEQLKCSRDEFAIALRAEGITSAVHYPTALTEQPVINAMCPDQPALPVCEKLAKQVLCLPCHHALSTEDIVLIADAVAKVCAGYAK